MGWLPKNFGFKFTAGYAFLFFSIPLLAITSVRRSVQKKAGEEFIENLREKSAWVEAELPYEQIKNKKKGGRLLF